ncbi:MAG: leucine-rich repeat domain-containing protein [Oscillospiraceae bacterium]|jgi:hypothetical protein|nr:leucine-rich repeat domain-containing protein [Oscillospiraceae bacterium]
MTNTLRKILLFALVGCFVAGSLTLILWQSLRTTKLAIKYVPAEGGLALKKYNGVSGATRLAIPDAAPDGNGAERPVVALEEFSVSNAGYLEELAIGANVETIHPWAVTNCEALRSVEVDPGNPHFASVDGVLYSRDRTKLVLYPNMRGERFEIPAGVTAIGENAFYKCKNLREVEFPPGLRVLEERAFFRCTGLGTLRLPEGLEVIGVDAFAFCDGLTGDITIPASCREIRDYAFSSKDSKIGKIFILAGEDNIALARDWLPLKEKKATARVEFEFVEHR